MPNWKKVIVSGSDAAVNSLLVTGGITGSLLGTASTASYVDLVAGPNITINQVGTSFEITGSGGGGGDTNFANTDLTFTGTRTHDLSGNSLSLLNGGSIILSGSGGFNSILLSHDTNTLSIQSTRTTFNTRNADIDFRVRSVGTDYALNVDGGTDRVSINKNFPNATLDVNGDTIISGSLNVTASFTASGLNYPNTDGIDGQVLKTDGNGVLSFENVTNTTISIKNVSGVTIQKGTPCYVTESGTSGNVAGVIPADAGNASLMPAGVIAGQLLNDGDEGIGLIDGFINGVDTSAFNSGDEVFVAVGGGYTNIIPTGSALIQKLGNVEKVDNTNGSGVINGPGAVRSVPNIEPGYLWVGDSDWVATPTPTSSIQNVVSSSYALTASYVAGASSFPFTGSALITGSLGVTGSISITQNITASNVLISSSGQNQLIIQGSGSTNPLFTIQGSQGELFSVTDLLSGSLFSVNDISGLPMLEVFSDSTTVWGDFTAPSMNTTFIKETSAGNNILYTNIPTSSYDGVFIDYVAKSASNSRAGNIMGNWEGSTLNFTETTTTSIGNTSGVNFHLFITGSNIAVSASTSTADWTIKGIIRTI